MWSDHYGILSWQLLGKNKKQSPFAITSCHYCKLRPCACTSVLIPCLWRNLAVMQSDELEKYLFAAIFKEKLSRLMIFSEPCLVGRPTSLFCRLTQYASPTQNAIYFSPSRLRVLGVLTLYLMFRLAYIGMCSVQHTQPCDQSSIHRNLFSPAYVAL